MSPAVDAGNPATAAPSFPECQTVDQRGEIRPAPDGSGGMTAVCDIGAFELQFDPGEFVWAQASYSVNEADGTLTLEILRTGGVAGVAFVEAQTMDGTATEASDYSPFFDSFTFMDGQASQTLQVVIQDDSLEEGAENFTLVLSDPAGGATVGQPDVATVTILDDDQSGAVVAIPTLGAGSVALLVVLIAWLGLWSYRNRIGWP
jgi:hypothetical protein